MATKFITVSVEILRDGNLNQSQKFLLAEIEQLTTLEKGCIASNLHFSNLIGITKENVSRNINELEKKGYISIEIVKGTRNHTRIITLTTLVRPPYQNSKTPLLKQQETKENITYNKQLEEDFEVIWKEYTLGFIKLLGRNGGSKKEAFSGFKKLRSKYELKEIKELVFYNKSLQFGHKDLERILRLDVIKQYSEEKEQINEDRYVEFIQ